MNKQIFVFSLNHREKKKINQIRWKEKKNNFVASGEGWNKSVRKEPLAKHGSLYSKALPKTFILQHTIYT